MAKLTKNQKAAAEKMDSDKKYSIEEAVSVAKEVKASKFDESVDMSIRLGVNPTKADQMVRGSIILPGGNGKTQRVIVFAKGEKEQEAKDAGADFVGLEEIITKIQGGWLDFDVAVATPDVMGLVGKVAKVLGPRGLMPNPKSGTVTQDVKKAIDEIRAGKVEFRVDKAGVIHACVGKSSFEESKLVENAKALVGELLRLKPASAKGTYIKGASISTTMGPGIKLDEAALVASVR